MDAEIKLIDRKIHYYELHPKFSEDFKTRREDGDLFIEFFSSIALLAKTKDEMRYQEIKDAKIFMQDVKFIDAEKKIIGKLRSIRTDVFPEIMNLETDTTKEIEAAEEEGIVETTHFIIDYNKKNKKIAIEHNQAGAKISEFQIYCERIGIMKNSAHAMQFIPFAKNELSGFKARINFLSELVIKVHKDNIEAIEKIDDGIYSALQHTVEQFKAEYAVLKLKFDYKKIQGEQKINKTVNNLISKLLEDRKRAFLFDTLRVRAQDEERNNQLQVFDLLIDKVESQIKVQRKPKYKTIVSEDIFEKMKDEMRKRRI